MKVLGQGHRWVWGLTNPDWQEKGWMIHIKVQRYCLKTPKSYYMLKAGIIVKIIHDLKNIEI